MNEKLSSPYPEEKIAKTQASLQHRKLAKKNRPLAHRDEDKKKSAAAGFARHPDPPRNPVLPQPYIGSSPWHRARAAINKRQQQQTAAAAGRVAPRGDDVSVHLASLLTRPLELSWFRLLVQRVLLDEMSRMTRSSGSLELEQVHGVCHLGDWICLLREGGCLQTTRGRSDRRGTRASGSVFGDEKSRK